MTCMDKNHIILPTMEGKASQQKRRPLRSALKNGGSNKTRIPDLLQISPCVRRLWRQNALCGLEENRRYGYLAQKSQRQNFIG